MKKISRFLALLLALVMLLAVVASSLASAAEERWEKDVYAYGAGLNESQIAKTADLLGIENLDKVNKIKVAGKDIYKYLKINSKDASMISSIYVMKSKKGQGLEITITTPDNITRVTGAEYTNAAITAGAKDAKIRVAAYRPVTGTSALTAVYKAFEMNGESFDEDRIKVANEELEIVNAIVQEHKGQKGFEIEDLNQAVIKVKKDLVDHKKKSGNKATEEEIKGYVTEAMDKNNLTNIVTNININSLTNYFQNFQNTSAIDSPEFMDQLSSFQKNLSKKSSEFIKGAENFIKKGYESTKNALGQGSENAKDNLQKASDGVKGALNSPEARNIFQKIGDFFVNLFNAIVNFFRNLIK